MKQFIKLCLFLLMILLQPVTMYSQDFNVDGIYYNIIGNEVEVTHEGPYYFEAVPYSGSVTIPETVTYGGITYPVTGIGYGAFYWCPEMTSIIIPNSITRIDGEAFYGCSGLTSITIPESVTTIRDEAFSGCNGLTSLTIPSSVAFIYSGAFSECCGLTSVIIQNSVIGVEEFRGCSGLTSVTISNSVRSIGKSAFSYCSGLNTVNIPESISLIDERAFFGCSSLSGELTIPNSVTTIGSQAFYNCSGLTSVTISNTVTSIGSKAFYECQNLTKVTSLNTTPPSCADLNTFNNNVYSHANLYVPEESLSKYIASANWGQFVNIGVNTSSNVFAESVVLNNRFINMGVGATSQLIATVLPDSTTNKAVIWGTDNSEVATVNSMGLVTAVAKGTSIITATTTDGTNLSASCTVEVYDDLSQFDNYLWMADTTVMHGDVIALPVAMINSEAIMAFQTDIFLPEGFAIVTDDNDEYMITPSDRMTSDHMIMTQNVSNGALRVVCYTPQSQSFRGNEGDLFYILVQVPEGISGDYAIALRNSRLTTADYTEMRIPDVGATIMVKQFIPGDVNDSRTVTVTDIVVTAQYVLEMNPDPFIFDAADMNGDGEVTVTDIMLIAYLINHPTMKEPRRMPVLTTCNDRLNSEEINLTIGETRSVSIALDNVMDYSAFQLDLTLPDGVTASNFALTDRAYNHIIDASTLENGKIRILCYSPVIEAIRGNEGALLTFDVTATSHATDCISADGIELVTTDCQTVLLDSFTIGVNTATSLNELGNTKSIARVDYYNIAGQRIEHPENGVTFVVTTFTDGSRSTIVKALRDY